MDSPHSPLPDASSRDHLSARSPSPPAQQQHYQHHHHQQHHPHLPSAHPHPHPQHSYSPASAQQYHPQHAYEDYARPDSRLSGSRLLPPTSAVPGRQPTPSANADDKTPPASPPHKRSRHEGSDANAHSHTHSNANAHAHEQPPPYPCHVEQRWVRVRSSLLIAFLVLTRPSPITFLPVLDG
ncbi:hypothetical protein BD414DRAFT_498106 [Trametes punicea]|nr:hypothetical protein BD414DRAFT_498106 [Trametes punicea]